MPHAGTVEVMKAAKVLKLFDSLCRLTNGLYLNINLMCSRYHFPTT